MVYKNLLPFVRILRLGTHNPNKQVSPGAAKAIPEDTVLCSYLQWNTKKEFSGLTISPKRKYAVEFSRSQSL